ncbi:MAG: phosphopyruvate hydratase [Planctomycetes bacterium]|jgi:enolase|nr:phosphopyruvate hydratase [Planctomycetota bacterium]HON44499.1 phosphopyruvate hydratase [Planctomycetota bacterium]HPY76012.1 phosphopyruvate hydratase [Planctomycetota bacterium]HQB01554.1 phosphopyruvate hydratase [Planctomycetota bacterium]HRU52816.1 phosphopyruvate hydratase [Planctomycetota bacterium]
MKHGKAYLNRYFALTEEQIKKFTKDGEWIDDIKISQIKAREILDSRGNPTVEVDVELNNGSFGRAAVPSGASTGLREALELRDGDKKRYLGKGVSKAVNNVKEKIAPKLIGMPIFEQELIDNTMIKLDEECGKSEAKKGNLGANAILGVSMACVRAATFALYGPKGMAYRYIGGEDAATLPVPMLNSVNGGAHGEWVTDIQEFMIMPVNAPDFTTAIRMATEVYHQVPKVLKKAGYGKGLGIGNEGGYNPFFTGKFYEVFGERPVQGINAEPLWVFMEAIKQAGYKPGVDFVFTLDGAVSELETMAKELGKTDGHYRLQRDDQTLSSVEFAKFYDEFIEKIRDESGHQVLRSIEDGLSENDWAGWHEMNKMLGGKIQLVLDDPTCTNPELLKKAIKEKSGNAILIKLNQIGTVTETLSTIELAREAGFGIVISHRSGETEDCFIADLAVGTCAGQIKTGAPQRSDRNSKYNELLRIEEDLKERGKTPVYPGMKVFTNAEVHKAQF